MGATPALAQRLARAGHDHGRQCHAAGQFDKFGTPRFGLDEADPMAAIFVVQGASPFESCRPSGNATICSRFPNVNSQLGHSATPVDK